MRVWYGIAQDLCHKFTAVCWLIVKIIRDSIHLFSSSGMSLAKENQDEVYKLWSYQNLAITKVLREGVCSYFIYTLNSTSIYIYLHFMFGYTTKFKALPVSFRTFKCSTCVGRVKSLTYEHSFFYFSLACCN